MTIIVAARMGGAITLAADRQTSIGAKQVEHAAHGLVVCEV